MNPKDKINRNLDAARADLAADGAPLTGDDCETVRLYPWTEGIDPEGRLLLGCDECEEGVYLDGGQWDRETAARFMRQHRGCRFAHAPEIDYLTLKPV